MRPGPSCARLQVDGERADDLEPLLFLGSSGHGIVCVERRRRRGARCRARRLRLVRLARPAAAPLQRMLLEGAQLEIPERELQRFSDELCPALSSVAKVVSSDGSFTAPEISAPALVLRAHYGAEHVVERRVGVDLPGGHRDQARAARQRRRRDPGFVISKPSARSSATRSWATQVSEQFGLLDGAGRPACGPAVSLGGTDSMLLSTETLPALAQRSRRLGRDRGAAARLSRCRRVAEIGVSTGEIAGERDWFDLGVTINVDGRELPFAEVFAALARGETRMLLDDGAYFSLLAPRLQALRQLIEEARTLVDSPSAPLRISRYQAGLWAELAALGVVTEQAQAWRRQVGALLELEAVAEHEPPRGAGAQLRPYQREGFGWLATLWELELGGILADDMGLGKTLQALALICHARGRDRPGSVPRDRADERRLQLGRRRRSASRRV